MNDMKRIGLLLLAVMSLVSCSKVVVTMESITGSWLEQYDPSVFAMDGSAEFYFGVGNEYQFMTYDALSGETGTSNGHFALEGNNIVLYPEASIEGGSITYKVVKLTADEMEWQKEGTKYSKGTWGSDYRHFVRVRWGY